ENLLFDGRGISGVLDFDDARPSLREADLALSLLSLARDGNKEEEFSYDADLYRAGLAAYRAAARRLRLRLDHEALDARHLALAAAYDEVVVVLPDAEEAFTARAPLSAGERLGLLLPLLREALPRLPYLLPIKRGGRSAAQLAAALAALCPPFEAAVCRGAEE